MIEPDDTTLRERFAALRDAERERALPPHAIVAGARERQRAVPRPATRRPAWRIAAVAAAALVLAWIGVRLVPDPLPPLDPSQAGSLRMATDVLLETPGSGLLRDLEWNAAPSFGPPTDRSDRPRTQESWS